MSKFQVGDKVRVVQVTDEEQDPPEIITDPNHMMAKDWNNVTILGLVGEVVEVWENGYYTAGVRFDHMTEDESASFIDEDLELVKEEESKPNPNIKYGVNFFE